MLVNENKYAPNKNKNSGTQNQETTSIAATILNPTNSDEASNKFKIVAQ